jgi:hypothetical protein
MVSSTKGETPVESVILVAVDLSPVSQAVVHMALSVAAARPPSCTSYTCCGQAELIATRISGTVIEQTR